MVLAEAGFPTHQIADSIVGLSCIALAATLTSFLLSAGDGFAFRWVRWTWIAVTVCTAVAGLVSLFAAATAPGLYAGFVDEVPLVVAALFLVAALALPFLMPLLLTRSRELEMAGAAARTSEARFHAAAESTEDALMLLETLRDPTGRIEDFLFTYINSNAEKIILKPNSQVVGARISRVLPIHPAGKLFEQFRQVMLTGKPLVHEFPLDRNDPSGPWMRHQVAKLDDGLVITGRDITEHKHIETSLQSATHDPLTGLPNRRLLHDRLEQAMARADRYRTKVAILLLHLDGLEQINERYGRSAGDKAILATAARLRSAIRATDSVIRMAGDEFGGEFFIVVMPDMTLELDVRRAAATLVAIVRKPLAITGDTLQLRCSVGAVVYPDTAADIEGILSGTEIALSRAKGQGHNHYVLYKPASDLSANARFGSDATADEDTDSEQCAD